jgi:hypothetical protein
VILSFLIHPSDGKADNYMVQITRSQDDNSIANLRLVGIDNDRVFTSALKVQSFICFRFGSPLGCMLHYQHR